MGVGHLVPVCAFENLPMYYLSLSFYIPNVADWGEIRLQNGEFITTQEHLSGTDLSPWSTSP